MSRITALLLRSRLASAYKSVFSGPDGSKVLADLHDFCRENQDLFHDDPHRTAYDLGRRRVFLRIQAFLEMERGDLTRKIQQERENVRRESEYEPE